MKKIIYGLLLISSRKNKIEIICIASLSWLVIITEIKVESSLICI